MNKSLLRILILTIMTVPAVASFPAEVVPPAPGQLHGCVASPETETELTVRGTINANDLFFIAGMMPRLKLLDLSDCSIVGCEGSLKPGSSPSYAEGVIPSGVFAGSPLEQVVLPRTQSVEIGEMAFCGSALRSVTAGPNITAIGMGAFSACQSLENAAVNGSCRLGSHIFADCTSLVQADVTDCDSIGDSMFARCKALSVINGSDGIVSVGRDAFAGCSALTAFDFGSRLRVIGEGAFASSGVETVDLRGCKTLTAIGDWAFAGCRSLASADFPDGLMKLGRGILFDCSTLGAFAFPSSTETVGDYALKGLSSVAELTLPADLSHIGTLAMSGMDSLKAIYAEDLSSVPSLGDDVWDRLDKSDVSLTVPADKVEDFEGAPQWQDFTILTSTSSEAPVLADSSVFRISGRFDGAFLYVRCDGNVLTDVRVYDLAGRCLAGVRPDTETAVIDCGHLEGSVFIVEAYTVSGLRAAVKLSRRLK